MKEFARKAAIPAALAAGITIGAAVTVLAQGTTAGSYWYSGADLMSKDRLIRLAYAAGASDMLAAVMSLTSGDDEDAEAGIQQILDADACISRRTGGTLGQFTDWAENLWRGRREPAALVLLTDACR